jgi:hypothetical protein
MTASAGARSFVTSRQTSVLFYIFGFDCTDYSAVTRRCGGEESQPPGCRHDSQGHFVCVFLCENDLCNGADVLPDPSLQWCYSCSGSYKGSACGYNFDTSLVPTIACNGSCATVTEGETLTQYSVFDKLTRVHV